MSTFNIQLDWKNTSGSFKFEEYTRDHQIVLGGAQSLLTSAGPKFFGNAQAANPEELLLSALTSCHMLTFLAIASKSGYIVDSYSDKPSAILGKNDSNKISITEINLSPTIVFSGEKIPSAEQLKSLHEKAHNNCFIASSIKAKVNIIE